MWTAQGQAVNYLVFIWGEGRGLRVTELDAFPVAEGREGWHFRVQTDIALCH